MGEEHYIATGLPHSGGLSGHPNLPEYSQSPAIPHTASYQELTPYSTVSTFTLPTQCDSSLLTPISSAASPPLNQGRDLSNKYTVSPGTPQSQDSASPEDQKMYQTWTGHLELNPSGTSSPMTTQASVSADYLDPYMADGRRTPAPPPTYLGNFAVSDPSESHQIQQPESPYYHLGMQPMDHHNLSVRDAGPMVMDGSHRGVERSMSHVSSMPGSSAMSNSALPNMRHERRDSFDDHLFHHYTNMAPNRGPSASPGRRVSQGSGRVKKPRSSRRQSRNITRPADPSAEHRNCYGEEVPPSLKVDTPPQERCIWEARWKHRYSKGQNMWDKIWAEYDRMFEDHKVPKGRGARENLQMKFKRSRCKFLEWLPKDDEILSQAWHIMERDRYRTLLNLFLELGGSRNMCLGVEDVEVRVVHNLKLEENLYMETHGDMGIRRRRRTKGPSRKRGEDEYIPHGMDMMAGVGSAGDAMEHDAMIEQVFSSRAIKDEQDMSDSEGMDVAAWHRDMDTKVDPRVYLDRRGA